PPDRRRRRRAERRARRVGLIEAGEPLAGRLPAAAQLARRRRVVAHEAFEHVHRDDLPPAVALGRQRTPRSPPRSSGSLSFGSRARVKPALVTRPRGDFLTARYVPHRYFPDSHRSAGEGVAVVAPCVAPESVRGPLPRSRRPTAARPSAPSRGRR